MVVVEAASLSHVQKWWWTQESLVKTAQQKKVLWHEQEDLSLVPGVRGQKAEVVTCMWSQKGRKKKRKKSHLETHS